MNIHEIFENLIEIQSIFKTIGQHQLTIDEENKRLIFLKCQEKIKLQEKDEIDAQIICYKKELDELEIKCFNGEKNIEKSKLALAAANSKFHMETATNQLKLFQENYQSDSQSLFLAMEKIENSTPGQSEISQFLKNFNATFLEIESEVKLVVLREDNIIAELKKRAESVLDNCPDQIQHLFKGLLKNYKNPLIFVGLEANASCQGCFQRFERSTLEMVHSKKAVQTCPGCGRILIPHNN